MSFTPADLFTGGKAGAWYDPSDLSTLFQNSDGTGAVAVGDPVGYMADKSGNGSHAIQATSAARPVLQQDADGLLYLYFDGVDDTLKATGALSSTFSNAFMCVAHLLSSSEPGSLGTRFTGIGGDGRCAFPTADETLRFNDGFRNWDSGTYIQGEKIIHSLQKNGTTYTLRQNSVQVLNFDRGTEEQRANNILIGAHSSSTDQTEGHFYGGVWVEAVVTTTERDNAETYFTDLLDPAIDATGGSTAPAQTASGAGTRATDATGAGIVAAQTGSGAALRIIPGTGGGTSPAQTSSGVTLRTVTGAGAGTAPAQTGAGSVQPGSDATGGSTAPAQTASGAGLRAVAATGGGTAPIQTATGVALRVITGGGAGASPAQAGAGVALRIGDSAGAGTAPAQVGSGSGLREIVASGASTAPAQTSRGLNVLALPVPSWRTATVLAQDRSAAVAAQDRTAIVTRPAA